MNKKLIGKLGIVAVLALVMVFSSFSVSFAEQNDEVKEIKPIQMSPVSLSVLKVKPLFSPDSVRSGGCVADFNGDGIVDTRDLVTFLNAWSAKEISADLNKDGIIDDGDFKMFLNFWRNGCPASEDSRRCVSADFNDDGKVDTRDLLAFLNAWTNRDLSADMNNDGVLAPEDFKLFLELWKKCS